MDVFVPNKWWGPALERHRKLVHRYVSQDRFLVDPTTGNFARHVEQTAVSYNSFVNL